MTAAGLHAMSWLWTLLDVQNVKSPLATVHDLQNRIRWFSETITGGSTPHMASPHSPPVAVAHLGKHHLDSDTWIDDEHRWVEEKRRPEEEEQRRQDEKLNKLRLDRAKMETEVETLQLQATFQKQQTEMMRIRNLQAEEEIERVNTEAERSEAERVRELESHNAELRRKEEERQTLEAENRKQREARKKAEQELKAQHETIQGTLSKAHKIGFWELQNGAEHANFLKAFQNELRNNWMADRNDYPAVHRALMLFRDHFIGQWK